MADVKISALPAVATPASTDQFAVNQGGTTKRLTLEQVYQLSPGDIIETSFSGADNQSAATDVSGFAFATATVRAFDAFISVYIDATTDLHEAFSLKGIQNATGWDMTSDSVGDASGWSFSITNAGQIQYTSTLEAGWASATAKFRARTTTK